MEKMNPMIFYAIIYTMEMGLNKVYNYNKSIYVLWDHWVGINLDNIYTSDRMMTMHMYTCISNSKIIFSLCRLYADQAKNRTYSLCE